jgi:hypothetical protein
LDGFVGAQNSCDDKELNHVTVAGAGKKFVPAKAVIEGNEVVVSADGVSEITYDAINLHSAWAEFSRLRPEPLDVEGVCN